MRLRRNQTQIPAGSVTIRRLGAADAESVERLAGRDSKRAPSLDGGVLGAEVEGSLLAVLSLAGGEVIADPFSHTGELRSLLQLRAKQLRKRTAPARRTGQPAAALAGSPPGAGGRLLSLLPRA